MIPRSVRADIELFIEGGLAILRKIAQAGYDVLTDRPRLSKWEKGALALRDGAPSSADLNSNGSPQSGSAAAGAGNNLTSMCTGNLTALCTTYTGPPAGGAAGSTTTGTARPTSGAWNAGAY